MSGDTCQDEVCITCSDQLIEVVVTSVDGARSTAVRLSDGVACEVSVELLDGVRPGDHVLVHGGVALQHGSMETSP